LYRETEVIMFVEEEQTSKGSTFKGSVTMKHNTSCLGQSKRVINYLNNHVALIRTRC